VAHEFIEFLEATLIAEQSIRSRAVSFPALCSRSRGRLRRRFGFSIQAMQLVGFVLVGTV